jgi:hypothetical protein
VPPDPSFQPTAFRVLGCTHSRASALKSGSVSANWRLTFRFENGNAHDLDDEELAERFEMALRFDLQRMRVAQGARR